MSEKRLADINVCRHEDILIYTKRQSAQLPYNNKQNGQEVKCKHK